MSDDATRKQQRTVCERFGAHFEAAPSELKVGISPAVRAGVRPIHGLRVAPVGDTSGWYIWAGGEMSQDPDFFQPLCVEHLDDWCPGLKPYLGLPPGWRFVIDLKGYEDVWHDPELTLQ